MAKKHPKPAKISLNIYNIMMPINYPHLKAELNWYKIFNELIQDFSVDDVDLRQQKTLKVTGLSL